MQLIYVICHLNWFDIFDQVDATNEIIIVFSISQYFLNMGHFDSILAWLNKFQNIVNLIMTFFIIWWRLYFEILMILTINEKKAKCGKIHDKMLLIIQLDTSYLDCQEWNDAGIIFFIQPVIT